MQSCITTATRTLCCTRLCCQSPHRRTMGLRPMIRLIDRFPFSALLFNFKFCYFNSEQFSICI
ncbi:spidroin-1-like [Iris pallida]|uniref:Spidroin-1-like n=1 Tax=Iris pallida TaxID=29817 RepID=A0AAX6G8G7_IRIPA|nr:spidroin-1-like [Iris pallida]